MKKSYNNSQKLCSINPFNTLAHSLKNQSPSEKVAHLHIINPYQLYKKDLKFDLLKIRYGRHLLHIFTNTYS